MIEEAKPTITHVYSFMNGMTIVFDQYGKQMPEFQGPTDEVVPKIRAAGFGGKILHHYWRAIPANSVAQIAATWYET